MESLYEHAGGDTALHRVEELFYSKERERFVALYLHSIDEAGLPDDEPFREAVRSHLEFGSRVARQNSWAETETDLHPIREVPRWKWGFAQAMPTPESCC